MHETGEFNYEKARKQLMAQHASQSQEGAEESFKGRSFSYDSGNWMAARKNSLSSSSKRGPIINKDDDEGATV